MTTCNCGNYLSYGDVLRKPPTKGKLRSKALCPIMPKEDCYNCFLIRNYGTTNRDEIKIIKGERLKQRLRHRRELRERTQ